ncbi:MAG: fluoride efflux transporter CrcB [Thermocrispum sp.]
MTARADVLVAVAVGGAAGSLARFGLGEAMPHASGQLPAATLLANVTGCLLIGALMATITESANPHRLLRPFLGVGVLGGYTTFSTFAVEVLDTGAAGAVWPALLYAAGTVLLTLTATAAGMVLTRAVINRRRLGGREH